MKDVDWNCFGCYQIWLLPVILRMKDVDWNKHKSSPTYSKTVILRMKDVDWNYWRNAELVFLECHPSYEGCGLKSADDAHRGKRFMSSFVWRMWIEISLRRFIKWHIAVILRMKDVDWNTAKAQAPRKSQWSSFVWRMWIEMALYRPYYRPWWSSFVWRMWIEIALFFDIFKVWEVILRMKDVDWNSSSSHFFIISKRHPSYEGCGLKSRTPER